MILQNPSAKKFYNSLVDMNIADESFYNTLATINLTANGSFVQDINKNITHGMGSKKMFFSLKKWELKHMFVLLFKFIG